MNMLNGKVALITGASAGIGQATAVELAKSGAHLALVARREERLRQVAADCERWGVQALPIVADVAQNADIERIVQETTARFGRIDLLINNAGLSMGGPLADYDPDTIRRLVDVNLVAPIQLTRAVLPTMFAQGAGHIVNVSSIASETRNAGYSVYIATKAGLNGFSWALHQEVADKGVRVSVVMPGWTRTEMFQNFDEAEMRRAGLVNLFIGVDDPPKVARAILKAVIHNRREVFMGGPLIGAVVLFGRIAPALAARVSRWFADPNQVVEMVRKSGV